MPTDGDKSASETALFAQALSALKRRGSNVLVVGEGRDCSQLDACRRLLGDATAGPRHRILVSTAEGIDIDRRLPAEEPRSGSITLVDRTIKTRSAAAGETTNSTSSIGSVSTKLVEDEELGSLGEATAEAIAGIEAEGPLAPAELRVCVDSLTPLLEEYDDRDVSEFLGALGEEIRRVNAMGHVHLPVEYGSEPAETLAPAFDAVVELRVSGEESEQRWHLQDEEITTDWLAL
jgi:hypothetical protein